MTPNLLGGVLNAVDIKSTAGDHYAYYYPSHDDGKAPREDVPSRDEPEEATPGVVVAARTGTKT